MSEQSNKLVPKLRFPEFHETGKWVEDKFENFANFYKGKGVSKIDIDPNGKTPCIRYGELYTNYSEVINKVISKTNLPANELFFSKNNDVIIPASGETKWDIARASCVMLDDIALGGDLNVIRSNQNGVFISYYLNGAKKYAISKIAQGDSVVHVYASQLKLLKLFLPPKQEEQQKIADCLSSLDNLITVQNQKIQALKQHKKGLMQQLFPAEGEPVPKLRFPEFENSGAWEEVSIAQICETFSGGTPTSTEKSFYGGEIPFIRSAEIASNVTEIFLTDAGLKNSSAKMVNEGDVLVALYGANSGDVAISRINGAINQAILCLQSDTELRNRFIYLYLTYKKNYIVGKYIQGGQGNLSGEIVKSVKIPQPPKISNDDSELEKIANCLSSLDELITTQTQKLVALRTHKRGLMQQLFPALADVKND